MLSDIIDSAIDCDKIDYLTRDSLHCGVAFGNGLDIEGLLRSYCPVQNAQRLGISDLGIAPVEGLMVLQHQMLSAVYWHQTVRSITCMFHAVFAHLIGRKDIDKLRDFTTELKSSVSDSHALTNVITQRINKQKEAKEQLSQLVSFQINPDYNKIYSPICVYRPNDKPPKNSHVNIHSIIFQPSYQSTSASNLPIDWNAIGVLRQAFADAFDEKKMDILGISWLPKRRHLAET
jgi:HD superfamily phosphohydrolase